MGQAWKKVIESRDVNRLKPLDFVDYLFTESIELKGDRLYGDDQALIGGLGFFEDKPITFLAFAKGHDYEENVQGNFGMVNPPGYRKAIRLMEQAEKFHRPVITFIDTPGAYPGIEAEELGQGEAIASCINTMLHLATPSVAIVTGEGGSGGALCLSVADSILMLEDAIYSIVSPEGFSSILWKDKSRAEEAADLMKITAEDLLDIGFVDEIIQEDRLSKEEILAETKTTLSRHLEKICQEDGGERMMKKKSRFRAFGS